LRNKVTKIISGGQTGADRAALDFALASGFSTGGFVPRGRLAEDGTIPASYPDLVETASPDPAERTRLNVLNSDATLILTHGNLMGGSLLTAKLAAEHKKPVLTIDLQEHDLDKAVQIINEWLETTGSVTLNVAGPRASEDGDIYDAVTKLLHEVFDQAV
jgi:predicted Rossmann fold nucleotide-binding protein DprA/Smf involved in DNA uptake